MNETPNTGDPHVDRLILGVQRLQREHPEMFTRWNRIWEECQREATYYGA